MSGAASTRSDAGGAMPWDEASEGRETLVLPLSVVIPAYNRAQMLRRALASVSSQRPRRPAQVIVVDDGSSDETSEVGKALGATVIRHMHNQGLSAARNTGLKAASHEWVALLDSDDEWLPHHLATLWRLRDQHVLVASSSISCGTDPARDRYHGPVAREPVVFEDGSQLVFPENAITVSGSMLRRELALDLGGFRAHRGVVEDFDMWLRLLEQGTAVCSPDVSVVYHVHGDQMSSQDARTMQIAHLEAAEAHRQRVNGSRVPIRRWEGVAAWDNMRSAIERRQATQATVWALRIGLYPRRLDGVVRLCLNRHGVRRRSAALRAAGAGRERPPGSL
jgi:GT2 family glycosyltransferase